MSVASRSPIRRAGLGLRNVATSARDLLVAHWAIVALAIGGIALRIVAQAAYDPALFYAGDSFLYLAGAEDPQPGWNPVGYPMLLRGLRSLHRIAAIPAAQHLMGVCIGVVVYALLRHLGLRAGLAALAAAPVLLDAYQVNIETYVLAEVPMQFATVLALAVMLWSRRPSLAAVTSGGLLLALAAIFRTAALVTIVPAVLLALARRWGATRVAVLVAVFAAPLALHTVWFEAIHGRYALSTHDGVRLYGRVAPFADCAKLDRPHLRALCVDVPPDQRHDSGWFLWSPDAPLRRYRGPPVANEAAGEFARTVVRQQPFTYAQTIGHEFAHYFGVRRWGGPRDSQRNSWRFPERIDHHDRILQAAREFGDPLATPRVRRGPARFLRAYQGFARTPGIVPAVLIGGPILLSPLMRPGRWRRGEFAALAVTGLLLVLVPTMTVEYGMRFFMPSLPLLSAAAALGADRLLHLRHSRRFFLIKRGESVAMPAEADAPASAQRDGSIAATRSRGLGAGYGPGPSTR